ncbi:efflux RND transporter periplasmic adaptor subunit [Maridesulfovibrio ferrireducens]|uniref:efflux RND transporter periplasmic adaptor subunit n=1 Tax=Maridesulfovibrio ferrireducens TaxID=246191 RepID=UPI001A1D9E10|nr:efflux RND transporter periplasmic adaptor subunit [Maridesulfovibrio ferrireducens]MBI9111278.1 efflux RND transporter periplasmic adaptor subunit [Maridesulfovibrio ferrireducens]
MHKMIIFTLLAMLILLPGCKEEVKKELPVRPVRVLEISNNTSPELRTYPGKVKAVREVGLAFRVPGQIVHFNVKEGDYVEKGQAIASLDQRDFQAAVADLQAKLNGARSILNEAELNYERNRKLLDSDTIAQASFDSAKSSFETSRASMNSIMQELMRANLTLQYTVLTAPFSGTIAYKSVDNHEYIQAKETIVQLEDLSTLDVVIDIPEAVWVRAFSGKTVENVKAIARFESYQEETFKLRVKEFQTKANPQTQTYEVTLNMENPDGFSIHPGMTAEVVASMPEADGVKSVAIPISAVLGAPGDKKYVWIFRNGGVQRREIEVGRIFKDMFEVHKGINPGEVVVVSGVNYLYEGQIVKVLKGRIGSRG